MQTGPRQGGGRGGQCPGAARLVKRRNSWWWKVVVVVVGRHFSTRPGAAHPHVGTLHADRWYLADRQVSCNVAAGL